jgi:uncharacterized protein
LTLGSGTPLRQNQSERILSKFLLLIFAVIGAWWLIKRLRGRDAAKDASEFAANEPVPEQMVACSHCGLNVPQKEAVVKGDKYFCCAEHSRRAG